MRSFRKSLVAWLTLICLVASFLPASAAAQPGNYSVKVEGGIVWFIRDGKAAKYTVLQPVELILRTDKDGELIVGIRTEDGHRYITLGDQKTIDVSGEIGKLVLSVSLDPGISVSVGEKSNIQELYVRNDGDVTVAGETGKVKVTGAANVTFEGSAYVKTLTVTNDRASVLVKPGAVVEQVFAVFGAKLSGVSAVSPLPPETSEPSASDSKPGKSSNSQEIAEIQPEVPGGQSDAISIVGIYPSRGAVQVKLSRPVALDQSAFYIRCPSGKDMTILSVSTSDNQVYNLTTAFYADNTYRMEITLPDGRLITRNFTTSGGVPQIKNAVVSRVSETELAFTFSADDLGILYYMAVPNTRGRAAIGTAAPSSAEDLVQNGESTEIWQNQNSLSITGLTKSTPYTLYYAVGDEDGNTPVMQPELAVPAEPPGPITITAENVTDDHFRVTLSEPTSNPLKVSDFHASCPASTITLGRVETNDNRVYEVYLSAGSHLLSNNTITVTVTFPDGAIATDSFYCDNSGPKLTGIKANWSSDSSSVILRATSDESGTLYYATGDSENKPAPDALAASGYSQNLSAGKNEWTLDEGIQSDHVTVYFVAKDNYGNLSSFTNSASIGQPLEPDQPTTNEIVSITQLSDTSSPPCTQIGVQLKGMVSYSDATNPVNFTIIVLEADPGSVPGVSGISTGGGSIKPLANFTLQFAGILPNGKYRLEFTTSDGVLKKEFSITN